MYTLDRTQIYFENTDDLFEECLKLIELNSSIFDELDSEEEDLISLMEDLADLDPNIILDVFNMLLSHSNLGEQFVKETLTYWEEIEPDLFEEIATALADD